MTDRDELAKLLFQETNLTTDACGLLADKVLALKPSPSDNAALLEEAKAYDPKRFNPVKAVSLIDRLAAAPSQDPTLSVLQARDAEKWAEGYAAGEADEAFYARGLSSDKDAADHPHSNPYRLTPTEDADRTVTDYHQCGHGFHHPPWPHSCDGCYCGLTPTEGDEK